MYINCYMLVVLYLSYHVSNYSVHLWIVKPFGFPHVQRLHLSRQCRVNKNKDLSMFCFSFNFKATLCKVEESQKGQFILGQIN